MPSHESPLTSIDVPPEPLLLELGKQDCHVFHNIPFTDVGWPNQFLPAGYQAADASSVWGMPVNFQFSAVGIGVVACGGDNPWWLGALHVMIEPPSVDGFEPVQPTSTPSPFTAVDGGFNFYVLEWYADGETFTTLHERGWNVIEASMDLRPPQHIPVTPHRDELPDEAAPANGFYYTVEDVGVRLRDEEGDRATFGNSLDTVWNHRNFSFVMFHETLHGTAALEFTTGPDHLLVGQASCQFRQGTLAFDIFRSMEFHGEARQRLSDDCPEDGLGAYWAETDSPAAWIRDVPGVFAR